VIFSADSAALAEARAGDFSRAAGFATKPYVVEELLATVNSAVEGPAAPAAGISVFPKDGLPPAAAWPETDLFATIVHELRQPLTVIRGQLQLGRRQIGKDPERERDTFDLAIAQVDRMAKLLSALLDAAALAVNGLSLTVVAFDLAPAIADAIARHEDGATRRITFHCPEGPVPVRGDLDRTAEILDNLLGNARKYSPAEAPIEVSLTMLGAEAQVRVADHGVGVRADERGRLFTPFFRSSSTRSVPGTGLGLHISQRLAERQGGRLWLETSSSAGSVFALALPLAMDEHGSAGSLDRDRPSIAEIWDRTAPLPH
jgi:signal transduction histidine kinase